MLALIPLLSRFILAAVFAVAGLAKLIDPLATRKTMAAFGLPRRAANLVALLLPFAELACAVALVSGPLARLGALGALLLLLAFIAAIAWNLWRGNTPNCRCFGQLGPAPISAATLLRNTLLSLLAILVFVLGPAVRIVPWVDYQSLPAALAFAAIVFLLLVVVAQGWVLVQAFLHIEKLNQRLRLAEAHLGSGAGPLAAQDMKAGGLPLGAPAPDFELPDLQGETVSLAARLSAGRPLLLVFLSPACPACKDLLPDLAAWQRAYAGRLSVTPISSGSREANLAMSAGLGLDGILLQDERSVAEAYHSRQTPEAVLIRPDGTLGSPLAGGNDSIRALVKEFLVT
jgi:uncharacterized membrane protein YphA (DoxX/SURF4 family)/peroxiredoxin